jgi:hypothetical protein
MLRSTARLALVPLLLAGASSAWAFSAGPPASRTSARALGAYPAESNCTSCHSGNAINNANGKIEILGLPTGYVPGNSYPLTVRLTYSLADTTGASNPRWGFELTAVTQTDGMGIGTIQTPPPGAAPLYPDSLLIKTASGGTFLTSNRQYLEQSSFAIRTDQPGPVEWPFTWVAPPGDAGRIFFFASGNAANGNGSTSGDFVFTSADSMDFQDPNAVPATTPALTVLLFATLVGAGIVIARRRAA